MPNGVTSRFSLTEEELGRLLVDLPEDAVIGKDFGKTVTTLEMKRRLEEHQENEVKVDEDDHGYIVRFMKPSMGSFPEHQGLFGRLLRRIVEPGKSGRSTHYNWVDVDESSHLHNRLRQYHAEWLQRRQSGEVVLLHGRLLQYDGKEWRKKRFHKKGIRLALRWSYPVSKLQILGSSPICGELRQAERQRRSILQARVGATAPTLGACGGCPPTLKGLRPVPAGSTQGNGCAATLG